MSSAFLLGTIFSFLGQVSRFDNFPSRLIKIGQTGLFAQSDIDYGYFDPCLLKGSRPRRMQPLHGSKKGEACFIVRLLREAHEYHRHHLWTKK